MSEHIARTTELSEPYEPYIPGQRSEVQDPRPRPQMVDVSTIMPPEVADRFRSMDDSRKLGAQIQIDTMSADELLRAMRDAKGDETVAMRILGEKYAQLEDILRREGERGVTVEQVHDAYQRKLALDQVGQALRAKAADGFGITTTEGIYRQFLSNVDLGVQTYNSNAEQFVAAQPAGAEVVPLKRKRAGKFGRALRRLAGRRAA